MPRSAAFVAGLVFLSGWGFAAGEAVPPQRLKVALVQMALSDSVAGNRDKIVAGIADGASRGARVVVFPEGALCGAGGGDPAVVDEALAAIRRAAKASNVYVLFGGKAWTASVQREANWMRVVGPDGRELLHYDKMYDVRRGPMPGVFEIDGVPCHAMICADRWLRGIEEVPIQQGARISFELSNNFACEWVAPLEWYWNVPRAVRNDVWVLFTNTGNPASADAGNRPCHGHSAAIAPDGRVTAASRDDLETIVVADLDLSEATGEAAHARGSHPALRPFWEAGVRLHGGETVEAPAVSPLPSAETEVTIAAAQAAGDLESMLSMIGEARAKRADLVVFPARAIADTALSRFQAAAREHRLTVVVGIEHRDGYAKYNSAFVIGPDGKVLTRYDQLSARAPFAPGLDPKAMWFEVKGVPAVVTIGDDAHWTELAELAAINGARIHAHLDCDAATGPAADLRRRQVWSNLASYHTFGATVNFVGSALWDDTRDLEERRAEVKGTPRPDSGAVEIYSPFSANLVAGAGEGRELLVATRRIAGANPHYPGRTAHFNPQMDAWYRLGAAIVRPDK